MSLSVANEICVSATIARSDEARLRRARCESRPISAVEEKLSAASVVEIRSRHTVMSRPSLRRVGGEMRHFDMEDACPTSTIGQDF